MGIRLLIGDVRDRLRDIPNESVHCVVTSPPYFGLRDYGTATWEGGEETCDHLGDPVKIRAGFNARYHGTPTAPDSKQDALREPFREQCGKCGARRIDSQIGLEPTPDEFVAVMVEVFREVRRVLRKDGTLWLNLGDSYSGGKVGRADTGDADLARRAAQYGTGTGAATGPREFRQRDIPEGLKPKDLIGIPWRVAFALQADGWYLRQDIIWHKPNPMPESVRDRCTKAHEYVFLLTKSPRYYYDADAISEPNSDIVQRSIEKHSGNPAVAHARRNGNIGSAPDRGDATKKLRISNNAFANPNGRNRRSVWNITTQPFPEAHFATFPPELPELCIKAGTSERGCCPHCGAGWARDVERIGGSYAERKANGVGGPYNMKPQEYQTCGTSQAITKGWQPACSCPAGAPVPATVLDPFGGAGTTGLVADRLGRNAILIELSPEYAALAERRITGDAPLFADVIGA